MQFPTSFQFYNDLEFYSLSYLNKLLQQDPNLTINTLWIILTGTEVMFPAVDSIWGIWVKVLTFSWRLTDVSRSQFSWKLRLSLWRASPQSTFTLIQLSSLMDPQNKIKRLFNFTETSGGKNHQHISIHQKNNLRFQHSKTDTHITVFI